MYRRSWQILQRTATVHGDTWTVQIAVQQTTQETPASVQSGKICWRRNLKNKQGFTYIFEILYVTNVYIDVYIVSLWWLLAKRDAFKFFHFFQTIAMETHFGTQSFKIQLANKQIRKQQIKFNSSIIKTGWQSLTFRTSWSKIFGFCHQTISITSTDRHTTFQT